METLLSSQNRLRQAHCENKDDSCLTLNSKVRKEERFFFFHREEGTLVLIVTRVATLGSKAQSEQMGAQVYGQVR